MRDPWKYLAFPIAALTGYSASMIATKGLSETIGLPNFTVNLGIIAVSGLITGFVIDELIPAYIEKVRGGTDAAGDFDDSGFDDSGFDDSDLEGDMDFD